jgi:hypothetical protein
MTVAQHNPDRYTARINISHKVGRRFLWVRIGVEGQMPLTVWSYNCRVNMMDDTNDLVIDVALPQYAHSFWNGPWWYVEIIDSSPAGSPSVTGYLEDVVLVQRLFDSTYATCTPSLTRPCISPSRFPITRGGTLRVYIPSRKSTKPVQIYNVREIRLVTLGCYKHLVKVKGLGGSGSNMFALQEVNGELTGLPGYDYWIGTQQLGSPVTAIVAGDDSTMVGFADGRVLKVRDTGGAGQNMFAVTPSADGFDTVAGYDYLIGSQKFSSGVCGLYRIGEVLFIALEDSTLVKVKGLGGSGSNMFALQEVDGELTGLPGYDYWIGTQSM